MLIMGGVNTMKVTEVAATKFKEIVTEKKGSADTMLRVSFGGFGWGGPQLQLTLDELINDDDVLVESEGVKVVYASAIERYINSSIIDYANNFFNRGFYIKGSNACM